MVILNKIVEFIIPGFIFIVFGIGLLEKKDIFKLFLNGVEDGLKQLYKIIPIIIAFFFLSGIIVSSNIIEIIFGNVIKVPEGIDKVLIVSMFKSISGSAGLSLGIEYLKSFGVESKLGIILSVILASSETTLYTYYRILWLMPMTVVIAYAGCKLIGHHIKMGVLLGCLVLVISGTYVYNSPHITKATNPYHLPQETIEICEMIRPAEGEERVWALFPAEQVHFVRQYTTTIQMPFGRDNLVESWDRIIHPLYTLLQQEVIPVDELSELSIESYCNYIILLKTMKVDGDLEEYGIKLIGETENYLVYRNTPVDFW